jgi:hypothetical protein
MKNLIFLGKLDSLDYSYLVRDKVMKIIKGTLVVMKD